MTPSSFPFNVQVCGEETIKVENENPIKVDFVIGKEPNVFKLKNIDQIFFNPSKSCPVSNLDVFASEDGKKPLQNDLIDILKFDNETNELEVKNNFKKATSFDVYIRASTIG